MFTARRASLEEILDAEEGEAIIEVAQRSGW
jgi:hypothetical protein